MPIAYIPARIFTGTNWLEHHAMVIEEGKIIDIVPAQSLPADITQQLFPECIIAPAFIDLQLYGARDKLFSVYPGTTALTQLKEYCAEGGTAFCLPTVATNTPEIFYKCIDAVKQYWSENGEGVLGLHLEGPWINSSKRGAHIASLIHEPTMKEVTELVAYGRGVIKMITLAPECCSKEIAALLISEGIIIAAGHSNASYEEANKGFDNGIKTATHLYNAMSALQHRAPGLVGAVLDHDSVTASIIPDGHHVDYAAIRIAKKIMKDRLFAITDSVTTTTEGPYQHVLAGDKYEAGNILSGSSLTMGKAVQNLVNFAGIQLEEALRMCSLYPAKIIGLNGQGMIEKGGSPRMVVLDGSLEVKQLL